MRNRILTKTMNYLRSCPWAAQAPIAELHLTRYFSTVELANASVGACMSYYRLSNNLLKAAEDVLGKHLSGRAAIGIHEGDIDELVSQVTSNAEQRYLVATSLMASLASALSAPMIVSGGDDVFATVCQRPSPWVDDAESALVVGFGGYLEALAEASTIKRLHVIDLFYERLCNTIEDELNVYRHKFPQKVISASACLSGTNLLSDYDLIAITGSTLCNGTLEDILGGARSDSIVVLQGQSASMHPRYLFEEGIAWISTTVKPHHLGRVARADYNGSALRPYLDGGLSIVYLVPRHGRS